MQVWMFSAQEDQESISCVAFLCVAGAAIEKQPKPWELATAAQRWFFSICWRAAQYVTQVNRKRLISIKVFVKKLMFAILCMLTSCMCMAQLGGTYTGVELPGSGIFHKRQESLISKESIPLQFHHLPFILTRVTTGELLT